MECQKEKVQFFYFFFENYFINLNGKESQFAEILKDRFKESKAKDFKILIDQLKQNNPPLISISSGGINEFYNSMKIYPRRFYLFFFKSNWCVLIVLNGLYLKKKFDWDNQKNNPHRYGCIFCICRAIG